MKKLILFVVLCTSMLHAQEYTQDNSSKIGFKIKNMGFNVNGGFDDHRTTVLFDENNLNASTIKSEISVKSVNTKNKKRDKHLINEDYFDTNRYDKITLNSTRILKLKTGNYQMTANLTIKNTTKKIVVPLSIKKYQNGITIDTTFKINRLDYSVGESSWVMGDIVTIKVYYKGKD